MQIDPVSEWQRLTDQYRRMSDEELIDLAEDFADLTEAARQLLRSELRSRGLGDPENASAPPQPRPVRSVPLPAPPISNAPKDSDSIVDRAAIAFGAGLPELVPDAPDTESEEVSGPHDYTWKTPLCECDTQEEAWQLSEALKQSGIESWIDRPQAYSPRHASLVGLPGFELIGMERPRVLVAADQLEQARLVAAQPIPREIVQASQMSASEFKAPRCPACGAPDPVLEAVDPENTWRCEQCGKEWTESLPGLAPGVAT
jgi:hypothetical protein